MHYITALAVTLLLAASSSADTSSIEERINAAIESINDGDELAGSGELQALERELQTLVAETPSADLYASLGRVLFYLENDSDATESLTRALSLDPDHWVAHRFQGLLHMYADRFPQAETSLRRAVALEAENSQVNLELGDVLRYAGKTQEAIASYEAALQLEPDNIEVKRRLAPLHARRGDLQKALEYYHAVVRVDSTDPDINYNIGQTYQSLGKHRKALKAFERVISIDPLDWRAKAKIIQENQALDRTGKRDAMRRSLFEQRSESPDSELGKAQFYCREQFRFEGKKVFAFEHFELIGEMPKIYEFHVLDPSVSEETMVISLGSYELTTAIFRERGKLADGERVYHLDTYSPNGHAGYGFFFELPSYEATKTMVLHVLDGSIQPVSSTRISSGKN